MVVSVSKSQFKAKALELFRLVETTREALIVTDRGQPVLELRPYQQVQSHPLDLLKGSVVHYERPTDPVAEDDWESME